MIFTKCPGCKHDNIHHASQEIKYCSNCGWDMIKNEPIPDIKQFKEFLGQLSRVQLTKGPRKNLFDALDKINQENKKPKPSGKYKLDWDDGLKKMEEEEKKRKKDKDK